MKTVRFTSVVETCGTPDVHLMLVAPAKDRELMKRLKQARVMTVHPATRGAGKDYGTVGLHRTPGAQLLIFPRSIKHYADQRVVGINYDLLAAPAAGKTMTEAPRDRGRSGTKVSAKKETRAVVVPFAREAGPESERPTPPTTRELVAEIQTVLRLLKKKKTAEVSERLRRLVDRIRAEPG